jgi:hypothetical protein
MISKEVKNDYIFKTDAYFSDVLLYLYANQQVLMHILCMHHNKLLKFLVFIDSLIAIKYILLNKSHYFELKS